MKWQNLLFASVISLGTMSSLDASAQNHPATITSEHIVRDFDITRDSPEFEQVRRWLSDAVARAKGRAGSVENVSRDAMGNTIHMEISHKGFEVTDAAAKAAPASLPSPWAPNAKGYNPGDTVKADVAGDGWAQTWTQTLTTTNAGLTWLITDYRMTRIPTDTPVTPR